MKKAVLFLGVLLSVGLVQLSCKRDDGDVDYYYADVEITRSQLPSGAQRQLADILNEGGVYTTRKDGTTYEGVTVTKITKKAVGDEVSGYIYYVELSNGIVLGYGDDVLHEIDGIIGNMLYAEDTNNPYLGGFRTSIWDRVTGYSVEEYIRNLTLGTKKGYAADNTTRYITSIVKVTNRLDGITEIVFTNKQVLVLNTKDGTKVSFKDKDGKDLVPVEVN